MNVLPKKIFKNKLGPYQLMIASQYFESIDDFKHLELATKNAKGNMEFVGIQRIRKKEERYEVHFTEILLEQCVTTHFLLRPGCLFVALHKDAQLSCLFPEDICLTLPVQKEMDFSLL